jgi:hypothetical protein
LRKCLREHDLVLAERVRATASRGGSRRETQGESSRVSGWEAGSEGQGVFVGDCRVEPQCDWCRGSEVDWTTPLPGNSLEQLRGRSRMHLRTGPRRDSCSGSRSPVRDGADARPRQNARPLFLTSSAPAAILGS